MTDRISVPTTPARAMASAMGFLALTPIGAGLTLLGVLGVSRGDWVSGPFLLLLGVPATLFCFAQIAASLRAASPIGEVLVLSKKTFYDCRIMKHAVPWSKLEWEICPRSGRVFIRVKPEYAHYMHRAIPDRFMVWINRRLGRFDYAVAGVSTGLPKDALAYEMRMHRRPTGQHTIRSKKMSTE